MVWPWAMEGMVKAGFELPLRRPELDFADAQQMHVLGELSACLLKFHQVPFIPHSLSPAQSAPDLP